MRADFRMGEWTVRPSLHRIERSGKTVQLEPRPMEVLIALADAEGAVLSRDDLLESVWVGVVVGEEALTRTISELRRALEDDAQHPRYIETIRKGGYRLVAAVEPLESDASDRAPARIGLLAIGLIIVLGAWWLTRDSAPPSLSPLASRPLTTLEGDEQWPALSADGTRLAYTAGERNLEIWARLIDDAAPMQVTDDPGIDAFPVWYSGGDSLSWVHIDDTGVSVRVAAFPGGTSRDVLRARHLVKGFSWVEDGRVILYSDVPEGTVIEDPRGPVPPSRIYTKDLLTAEETLVVEPEPGLDDSFPMISPDKRKVAFYRAGLGEDGDLYVADLAGGEPQLLVDIDSSLEGLSWDQESRSVVFSCGINGNYSLWRCWVDSGEMTWIPVSGEWMFTPVVAREADRLVYQHRWFEKNIWSVSRETPGARAVSTSALISSARWDCEARFSPDREHIAFVSTQSGSLEIWIANADGSQPRQLTHFGGVSVGSPFWAPDGRQIAFTASPDGFSDLFLVEPDGGRTTRLTEAGSNELFPSWTRDGKALVFSSDRTGRWEIWESPVQRPADAVRMTDDGGIYSRASIVDDAVYFARMHEDGVFRIGQDDDEPQKLAFGPGRGDWNNWDLFDSGIVYLDYDAEGEGTGAFLMDYQFGTDAPSIVAAVPNVAAPSITVTRDGGTLLYARIERSIVDLMLVEGFR